MAIKYEQNYNIKKHTAFKIGGAISHVYFPESAEEFVEIMKREPDAIVLGNISNVLVSDFGYTGAVILTSLMDKINIDGNKVVAQCGVKGQKLAKVCAENSLSGLEFLIGFPGAIGGEVYMNASANGQAISDNFVCAECYDCEKGLLKLSKDEMNFGYRSSICQEKKIKILSAEFELEKCENSEKVEKRMAECLEFRRSHQPLLNLPNCGSVFKNPTGNSAGRLLDECSMKGVMKGGVKVWENHANFIVNTNNGTSTEVLELMCEMKTAVQTKFNINLEPEIIFLGNNNEKERELCKMLYQKSQK